MHLLIATVTAGAGHLQAAAALEEAWHTARPRDAVERLDVLEFTSKFYRKVYTEGYVKFVERAPELWGMFFKKTDDPALMRKLTRFRRSMARLSTAKFVNEVKRFKPGVVLCTHFLPLEIMGRLQAGTKQPSALTVSVVTDFEAHALWMEPAVDLYCVAAEETKARLVARGVAAKNVAVTGIPIAAKFATPVDAAAVQRQLGLRDDLELMAVSSLVVTKPGGLTTSEALAMGRPIFVLNPIPGQEAANSDFLLEHGAAAKANRVEDLPFRLEKLLGSSKLAQMAAAAKRLGKPQAAAAVCREVLTRLA